MGSETKRSDGLSWDPAASAAPAEESFLRPNGGGYAGNDREGAASEPAHPLPRGGHGHFEIFREDEVSVTSTQFVGGGWRWRLSDGEGLVVAQAGDYPSEASCRAAVAAIQAHAGFATVR
jgi:uncharacterized protein YegP (UPF0339 family)